jgi:hypothetical protein
MLCCIFGLVVPDVTKAHNAFIFRVRQFFVVYLAVKINALRSLKTSGTASPVTERRIPKDLNLQNPKFLSFCKPCPIHDKFCSNISVPFTRYVLVFFTVLHYLMLDRVTHRHLFYRLSTVKAIEAFQQY